MGALALGCKIRVITDHKPLSYLDSLFARHNDDEDDNDGSMSVMNFANALVWEITGPAMAAQPDRVLRLCGDYVYRLSSYNKHNFLA